MPLKLRIDPTLDDGALSDVRQKAESFFDMVGHSSSGEFLTGFSRGIAGGSRIFSEISTAAADMGAGVSAGAATAAAGVAAIGTAAVVVGKQLYDMGAQWDTIADSITGRTGALGNELNDIVDSVRQVGDQSALSLQGIGDLATGVHSSLRLTGDEGTRMLQLLADIQQVTGQIVNTMGLGRAFRLFDVEDINAQTTAVNELLAVSQATQIPINQLIDGLVRTGRAGKDAGLDLEETLGVLTALNESGLTFEKAGTGLTFAIRQWAKDGKDANVELANTVQHVKDLIDAGNIPGAQTFLAETFGGRNYIDFFNAIKDGTLDVNTLKDALRNLNTADIDAQKKATEDWQEEWQKLTHHVQDVFKPAADVTFTYINNLIEYGIHQVEDFTNALAGLGYMFGQLPGQIWSGQWLPPAGPAGPSGPMPPGYTPQTPLGPPMPPRPGGPTTLDQALGLAPSTPAAPLPGPTTQPGQSTTGLGPNFYQQWYPPSGSNASGGGAKGATVPYPPGYTGSPVEKAQHDVAQAQSDLAAAQASGDPNKIAAANNRLVDANNNLQKALQGSPASGSAVQVPAPPGLGAPPLPGQTPEEYSRQQSYLGAVHTRQTAEAALEAARTSGTATPTDLVKAENDLAKARSDEYEAMLRLNDSASKASDVLGDIGVQLDQDFGLSKGLPGLAENLTRFLANLAFAPAMGAMRGAQAGLGYPGGEGSGSGLAGMIGSAVLGPGTPSGGGGNAAQFPFGGFPGGAFPGGYPTVPSGLPITYPGGSPYPASGQASAARIAPGGGAESYRPLVRQALATYGSRYGITNTQAWEDAIVRQIATESGGNPNAINRTDSNALAGHPSQGLLQFIPSTFAANNITGGNYLDPYAQIAAVLPYVTHRYGMDASGAPLQIGRGVGYAVGGGVDTVPAMLEPGEHVLTTADVDAMGGQSGVYAFRAALHQAGGEIKPPQPPQPPKPPPPPTIGGVPAPVGLPAPKAGAPHTGPNVGPTTIGGLAPPPGYGPGFTVTGGGLIGLLESLPSTAINLGISAAAGAAHEGGAVVGFQGGGDVASSVASAAINIGIEELNRAIGYAGQVAGIAGAGLMETFLPAGASELASNNWITRFLGGIVGARPALPNVAGKGSQVGAQQLGPPPLRTEHYGTGAPPGPVNNTGVNIQNYNVTQSEDRAGAALANHVMGAWSPVGAR